MAGRLIYNDRFIMEYVAGDTYLRGFLPSVSWKFVDKYTSGVPAHEQALRLMWYQCQCGVFRELDEVMHCRECACEACGAMFWERGFDAALRAALRLNWETAFRMLLERQNNELPYLVGLMPVYRDG